MAYFLVALTIYTFALRSIGLEGSILYSVVNPYVLLMPFIFIWQASVILIGRAVDRNLLLAWLLVLLFPCMMLRTGDMSFSFLVLFLKGLQYFFGPVLLVPALLGLFRMVNFDDVTFDTQRQFIRMLAGIAAAVTLFELFAVHIVGIPIRAIPWVGQELKAFHATDTRPWGILSYPQPNALTLAYLFWLAVLFETKGWLHKAAVLLATLLAGSGTAMFALVGLSPIATKKPLRILAFVLAPAVVLVVWATVTEQWHQKTPVFAKLDLAYSMRLLSLLFPYVQKFLDKFTATEVLFGSQAPDMSVVTGVSHDWSYLDIFVAYGVFGIVAYLLVYGSVLFFAITPNVNLSRRGFFTVALLALNFHYGTLNYYFDQYLFSILAALELNRIRSRGTEGASVAIRIAEQATTSGHEPAALRHL